MQLCSSLRILWHCLSLESEWKLTFSSPLATALFQICWHIECSTFTASSFRIWNSSTGIPSPPLAFFIVPMEKKCKKAKSLSGEALQIAEKRREAKGKWEKERYTHLNAEFQRIARRDNKAFLSDQCKETEENNRMGKTRDLFRKVRDTREKTFLQRWA